MAAIDIMNQVFTVFWIVLGMVALVGGWFFFAVVSKYKYKVRIREIVNGRKVIIDDKARLIKKDGLEYWKLMKLKDTIPLPPPEAIDITDKGKRVVELYKNDKGEHFYIHDNSAIGEFEPLTTEERDLLINGIDRAEKRRGKKWTEHLPMIAGLAALVLIVVCLMVFYNDMAKPLLEMGEKYNANKELDLKILEKLEALENNVQILSSEYDYKESTGNTAKPPR